jgi:bifunctional DNA primase/polymerase-like protein
MAKKIKVGLGKWKKQKKASDKRRKDEQPERHRRGHYPGNKESGSNNTRLEVALLCASAGLPVVPLHDVKRGLCTCGNKDCEQPGRHPRTKRATTDRALIKNYWTRRPKAKIGIVLGTASGVLALVAEGSAGKKTLSSLEEKTQ